MVHESERKNAVMKVEISYFAIQDLFFRKNENRDRNIEQQSNRISWRSGRREFSYQQSVSFFNLCKRGFCPNSNDPGFIPWQS